MRQLQRVASNRLLDRFPHLRARSEEAVRRHQPTQRLVRALEVVRPEVQLQPPGAVHEVGEHRPRQELLPQRLPEALNLSQCLRVLRPALHMGDTLPPQLAAELTLPAPHRVLPPLVRQDLPRRSVRRDPPEQGLHHQARLLMVRQRVAHDEPRVVVHERRQVDPLVPAQQEREDVALPELVRLRALEASGSGLRLRQRGPALRKQALFVEDATHRCLRHAEATEARQQVADLARAELRLRLLRRHYRSALHLGARSASTLLGAGCLGFERLLAALAVGLHPRQQSLETHPERPRDPSGLRAVVLDELHQPKPELERVPAKPSLRRLRARSFSLPHRLPFLDPGGVRLGQTVLGNFYAASTPINWRAAQVSR
jgi:hypothetical protein